MQLDGLAQLCFHFVENTIDVHTCLRAVRLSDLYGRDDVKVTAGKFLTEHIKEVISEPDFPAIPKENLTRYITASGASHEVSWRAVVTWLANDLDSKGSVFPELISFLKIQEYSYELMQKVVLNDSILGESEELTGLVARQWLSDIESFKKHLTSRNYYRVKSFVLKYATSDGKELDQYLRQFFAENFEELSMAEEFLECNEDEILPVFQNEKNQYFSEEVKWEAALKWVKHDEGRQEIFSVLFSTIKLNLLCPDFIRDDILTETLVEESHQCKDALLRNIYTKKEPAFQITWINSQKITTLDPSTKRCDTFGGMTGGIGIASVLGDLYLATRNNLFCLNQDGTWRSLPSPPQYITSTSTVLPFKNCVYVLRTNGKQWFDPVTNVWEEEEEERGFFTSDEDEGDDCVSTYTMMKGSCAIGTDDALYALGGVATRKKAGQTSCYRTKKANKLSSDYSVRSKIAPMNIARAYASAAILKGSIWVMGGGSKSVEVYHPVSNTWVRMPDMVFSREKLASCVIGNRLYVVGGACKQTNKFDPPVVVNAQDGRNFLEGDSIEVFDETNAKWKVIETLTNPVWNVSCCAYSHSMSKINPIPKSILTPIRSGFSFGSSSDSINPFTGFGGAKSLTGFAFGSG